MREAGRPSGESELSASGVERLRAAFERAGFDDLDSATGTPCADCFRYRIAYGGRVVRTEQSALEPRVEALIAKLDALAARVRRGNT